VRVAVQTAVVTPPTPGDPGGGDQGGGDQGERDPAPVTLASTGADIALPILFAATLLIAGAAVMSLRRRDRPTAG
jgi:LPXTG-motif cell wall-anchored protein